MGNIFRGSEIIELGIQIEKNGRDFYNVLTKNTKAKKASDIFKYLAGEEEKHIEIFGNILHKIGKYEPSGLDADDYFAYMDVLASEYIFTKEDKGKEIAKHIRNDLEAVNMGMGFEKDSIIFYEGMKRTVPEYDVKIVQELILQEQNHLKILSDLKKGLTGEGGKYE